MAKAFVSGWISGFGTSLRITTDQGRQFQSHAFRELNNLLGSQHLHTTAYHPASNGLVERMHRQLKTAIKCHATEKWTEILQIVLLGIRTAWREDHQATAAELIYGETLRLPGEFLAPRNNKGTIEASEFVRNLRETFQNLKPVPVPRHGEKKTFIFKDLRTAEKVFVRRGIPTKSLQPTYDRPFPDAKRSDKTFDVIINDKNVTVSIDRQKPAYVVAEEDNAALPKEPTGNQNQQPIQTKNVEYSLHNFLISNNLFPRLQNT